MPFVAPLTAWDAVAGFKDLPGRPDLAFPARRKAIFVDGCFRRRHDCPCGEQAPKQGPLWIPKPRRNEERDEECHRRLAEMGWRALLIMECEPKDRSALDGRIAAFPEA